MRRLLGLICMLAMIISGAGAVLAQTRLTIVGGVVGGAGYMQALGLNQVLLDYLKGVVIPTVQGTPGYVANAKRLYEGLADIGVVVTVDGYEILNRQGEFQEVKHAPLQMYPTLPPLYVHFIVRKNSPIQGFKDLDGKRINLLTRGSLAEKVGRQLLVALRIKPAKIYNYPHGEAASALASGTVDVVVAGGVAPNYAEVSLREPLRVLSLTEEEIALVRERIPLIPIEEVDFSEFYKGAEKAKVLAPWAVMAARHTLDANLVYQITKAVFDHYDEVEKIYKPASGLTPRMVLQTGYPVHPGAARFYREKGVRLPQAMQPPDWLYKKR
ncbi:MAG: TAXI family TRAP transporter solute-binding subunit [Armatimonadota bacterium]|nr:TAXI family TRAP transporter solute-binding subunit [Armatimonadota bacterium]